MRPAAPPPLDALQAAIDVRLYAPSGMHDFVRETSCIVLRWRFLQGRGDAEGAERDVAEAVCSREELERWRAYAATVV